MNRLDNTLPFPLCVNYIDYNPLLFEKIYTSWNSKKLGFEWESKLCFLSALSELIRLENLKKEEVNSTEEIVRVIDYININYYQTLTREQLASIIGLSPSYFTTMFKTCTGYTPINYLNKVRIDRVKQVLRSTTLSYPGYQSK